MANPDAPFGCQPTPGGTAGQFTPTQRYPFDATTGKFGIGQPMTRGADNKVSPWTSGAWQGIVVDIEWKDADGNPQGGPVYPGSVSGATDLFATLADDPNQEFEIQADDEFEETDLGQNANFTAASTSDTKGQSTVELDISSAATTATLPVRILKVADRINNEVGDYTVLVCKPNNHQNANSTAGA